MSGPHSHTVLVVEDDQQIRKVVVDALRSEGYGVEEVTDGAAAVHRLDQAVDGICMVVLDMNLPYVDGAQILQHRALGSGTLPIIAMSANPNLLAAARQAEAWETLDKPFGIADLLAAVES